MPFARISRLGVALTIMHAAAAQAQPSDAPFEQMSYTAGWQQWLHSKQNIETAPITRFEGPSYGIRQDGSLEFGYGWRADVINNVFAGRVARPLAGARPDIFAAIDQYLVTLGGDAGSKRIADVRLRNQDNKISGTISARVLTRYDGDTIVGTIRLRKMRDVAAVVIRDTIRWPDWIPGDGRTDVHLLQGSVHSFRLYNASTRRTVEERDSVVFRGQEKRMLPDGRTISDKVRVRQVRRGALISVSASIDSSGKSSLSPLGWSYQPPPRWVRLADSTSRELRPRMIAERDEAAAISMLQSWESMGYTKWHYSLMRNALDDPATAMRLGFNADAEIQTLTHLIASLAYVMPMFPTELLCTNDACDLIKQESTRARYQTLRDAGLLLRYVETPACYYSDVLPVITKETSTLGEIRPLVLGTTQYNSSAPLIEFPSIADNWRAWFNWLRGATPEFIAKQNQSAETSSINKRNWERPRTQSFLGHNEYRTGIAYRDSFSVRLKRESNDTARIVYSKLLEMLGPVSADTTSDAWRRNRACQSNQFKR